MKNQHIFQFYLFLIVLVFSDAAQADPGLSAIGDLFEGIWYLCIYWFGISTAICLIVGFIRRRSSKGKSPLSSILIVHLLLFTLFASRRFIYPELKLETLFIIVCTLLFYVSVIYQSGVSRVANYKAIGLMLFVTVFMLLNPRFITYNNHIFSNEPPFESTIKFTPVTHPVFSQISLNPSTRTNWGYANFLQTSDGAIYYGRDRISLQDEETFIDRVAAENCNEVCQHCSDDCFDFYSVYQTHYLLWKPVAHIDFQKSHNFPKAPYSTIPTHRLVRPIINIPIKDKVINPNNTIHRGTLKLVGRDNTIVWNPLNNWLWNNLCEENRSADEIDDLVWENIDPNYSPSGYSRTLFNCAIEKLGIEKIKFLAALGGDPNIKVYAGGEEDVNSMFVVMNQKISLDKKEQLFEFLIEYGANINAQSKKGSNLLHSVVKSNHIEDKVSLVELLLSLGVDKNSASYYGKTPIEYAQERRERLFMDIEYFEDASKWTDQQRKESQDRVQREITEINEIISLLEG